jgi:hypothetical protein
VTEATRAGPRPSTAEGRALSGAVWVSGVRCVLTYLALPALAPVLGATLAVAGPVIAALHVLGAALSVRALRRSVAAGRGGLAVVAGVLLLLNIIGLLAGR